MSLCRRPYIDRRKEFSEEERDRLTKIDNEIWEKAKDSKLFFKVYPLVGKPGYQIKNNASINSVYNFVSEINKKYDKKVVKLSKTTEFKKEILSVNVMPLSRETIRESYIQNLQAKNQQMIDARRSGIDYSEDYLFQESDVDDQKYSQDLGLEQRLFSESKDTTSLEILNKIANSDHNLASLAAHLIPYAKYNNVKISLVENIKTSLVARNPIGSYDPVKNDIEIKRTAKFTSGRAEAVILHEIIHSVTFYELLKNTEENAYFTELFNHAELYLGTLNLYGLSNKDEFMTALFTNADFIKQLQNVPPLNKKIYKNLFEEVFDKILKLLRITKSSPFYEEAFSTATNIIENFRKSTIEEESFRESYEEYIKDSDYENYLYSEGQTNIKPGVEELFDSNPELANAVYEALGFDNLTSKVTLSKKFADTYNIVYNGETIGTIDIPSDLEGNTISIGDVNIKPEFRGKGLGVETYKAAMKIAGKPLESFMATDEANRVWNSLIKQGLAKKTDTGFLTISAQVTPQQKQQALQQYSQYLDTIFPDSKVKDILYHASPGKFESFRENNFGTFFSYSPLNYLYGENIYRVVINSIKLLQKPNKNDSFDVKENYSKEYRLLQTFDWVEDGLNADGTKKYKKSYRYDSSIESSSVSKEGVQVRAQQPEQIHILGSQKDIKGFKEFVGESTQTVESYRAQEQAELSQRIPNIENYKVNGKVDKSLITDKNDLKTYNEIYDKYDALITPLLETSEKGTNTVKNKIAINKLFKSLPILDTIGTQEQYLRHFNSVYSDTSVPIVVYRAVKHEGSELKDKSFFTDDPEYAIKYGDILKPYKLNILNPYTSTKVGIHRASIGSMLEDPMVDGIIGKESLNNVSMRAVTIELQEAQEEGRYLSTEGAIRRLAGPLTDTNSFVTTNVNQVYELGTEIDVDNFKEFVRNDLGTKELNKKSVSLYSKIFDISEDEINEHLKNCG